MAQNEQGTVHPLFSMTFEDDEANKPTSQETTGEIDNAVEEFLNDQGLIEGEEGAEKAPVAAPEKPTADADLDPEMEGYSPAAMNAVFFQKEGSIAADAVISKDLDGPGLKALLLAQETKTDEEKAQAYVAKAKELLEQQGVSKIDFELLAHLKAGGSGVVVSRYNELQEWATTKPKNEEDKLEVIRFAAELAGQKEEFVEAYIANNLVDPDDIEKAFDEAQKTIGVVAERELEADKERVKLLNKAEEDQWSEFTNKVRQVLEKGFRGITLDKANQEKLLAYTTVKSIPNDVVKNGRKVREMITPYKAFGLKLQKDIEENMAFAFAAMSGSVGMVNAAVQAGNEKFLSAAAKAGRKSAPGSNSKAQVVQDDTEGELLAVIGF